MSQLKDKKILVTGGGGFLGSYVVKKLIEHGVKKKDIFVPLHKEYDLTKFTVCKKVVKGQDIIIHLAAKVGGIGLHKEKPGELFYENLLMGAHLIEAARLAGVQKFVGIGTVCAYPKHTPIPFKEKDLWMGYPEETTAPYGLAKKMLLVQGNEYRKQYGLNSIHLLPVNLYGPNDNFNENTSHVIPALILKFNKAKKEKKPEVVVWGSGKATREFLYVEDAAEGIVLATEKYNKSDPVNLGSSAEISIKEVAELIKKITRYRGKITWDSSMPDGQPRRKLDTSLAEKEFGFRSQTSLATGLKKTIEWHYNQFGK